MTEEIENALWDLVDKWRAEANAKDFDWVSLCPKIACAQGLNSAAEDLCDLLLGDD
ncbi:hypothetical protein JRC04_05425 [Mycolicibacterium sp. S2-37]|uniref:hypothetical protein n=1 Tax=Mycolicibacterium sp. S2-37 TaxID=2810297 RepID=UPI001A94CD18|nr:hypothetical protein [Mycolicibacterium sp. S2-37]MBO0676896.1 hypothetical protein [Mycolicibacterium sp. S2-37]